MENSESNVLASHTLTVKIGVLVCML